MKSFVFSAVVGVISFSSVTLAQSGLEGLSTGRYVVKKKQATAMPAKKPVRQLASEVQVSAQAQSSANTTTIVVAPTAVEKSEEKQEAKVEPNLADQAQGLFTAKTEEIQNFYREQVHPDDVRNNQLEIEFSPTMTYNESDANYSFRDYNSYFTALKVKAGIWLTPLIGLSGQFLFSLGSDIGSNDNTGSKVTTKYDNLDLSVNFRKFFGLSRRANSVETSILYSDYKFSPAGDAVARFKSKTSGFGLGIKARFPTSASYAWTLGGNFFPRLKHDETANAAGKGSGNAADSARVGFEVGGEFKFSRESQMIWSMGLTSERNMFDGPAFSADPQTSATPSNVSVTNSMYMFSLGYRWGH